MWGLTGDHHYRYPRGQAANSFWYSIGYPGCYERHADRGLDVNGCGETPGHGEGL